jgi:hypothetical protein
MTEHLMPRTLCAWIVLGLTLLTTLLHRDSAGAPIVWSGLTTSFSKPAGADPALPASQDRITNNVWVTRGQFAMGLLNAVLECPGGSCTYTHNVSPVGTEWATAGMLANTGKTIAATNWQNLSFTNWEAAYGNHVGGNILTPPYRDAVVHLIADNIYLDLRFTDWAQQGGGAFAYQRATGIPEPTAVIMMLAALIVFVPLTRWRHRSAPRQWRSTIHLSFLSPGRFLRSRSLRRIPAIIVFCALAVFCGGPGLGQTVWSGFDLSFSKAEFADPSLAAHQDRITSTVWITRQVNQGIYNIHDETGYSAPGSPVGTRWATDLNNPGKTIAATNWNNLAFSDWVSAYGGQGTHGLPTELLSHNAVVYLVADNTYLDLRFTGWSVGGGGGFAYDRAAPPNIPSPTGDYSQNGVVDGADYVVWRDTLGQAASPAGSGADGDQSAMIDSGDYTYWRQRFGNTVPGAGSGSGQLSVAGVPEPASSTLVCFCLNLLASRRLVLRGTENRN